MKLSALNQVFLYASLASCQMLAHPAVQPPLVNSQFVPALEKALPVPQHTVAILEHQIPQFCYSLTMNQNMNPAQVRGVSVTYADCPGKPWILCHHVNSNMTVDELVTTFGRIPVTSRSATKHWLTLPDTQCHGLTYNALNTIIFGHCDITTYLHENTHANDAYGFPIDGRTLGVRNSLYSASARWQGAYNKDTRVVTEYARTNFQEDLAASAFVAVYNANVKGGIKNVIPQHQSIYNQIRAYDHFRAQTKPGGTCPYRQPNDPLVPNGA